MQMKAMLIDTMYFSIMVKVVIKGYRVNIGGLLPETDTPPTFND